MFLLELSQRWLYFVYDWLDVTDYLFVVIYCILIFDNFKYAELAYHFFIEELFYRNEQRLEEVSKKIHSYFEANWRSVYDYLMKSLTQIL